MLQIGKINQVTVIDELPFGFYVGHDQDDKILLPMNVAPKGCAIGQQLDVFVYHDSEDRLIATTKSVKAQVNELAYLRVKNLTSVGAFLDWGLEKDLLLPFNEQAKPAAEGMGVVVYVYQDEHTERLAASTKLREFLSETGHELVEKQAVELIIYQRTELGYKAAINSTHLGLLFNDQVFKPLRVGDKVSGYIKQIRDDGKIDLCLQLHDNNARKALTEQIIEDLQAHGGMSTLTDKSTAEEIGQRFGVSKNAYKKALGALYKAKRIALDKTKVTLLEE